VQGLGQAGALPIVNRGLPTRMRCFRARKYGSSLRTWGTPSPYRRRIRLPRIPMC